MKYWNMVRRRSVRPWETAINICDEDVGDISSVVSAAGRVRGLAINAQVDLSGIHDLKNLEELSLGHMVHGIVDLRWFPNLRSLSLHLSSMLRVLSVELGAQLTGLGLTSCSIEWAAAIERNMVLENLSLISPRAFPGRLPESLRYLSVAVCSASAFPDFAGERLVELRLEEVRELRDFSKFSGCTNLSTVYVEDCPGLSSRDGLASGCQVLAVGCTPLRGD